MPANDLMIMLKKKVNMYWWIQLTAILKKVYSFLMKNSFFKKTFLRKIWNKSKYTEQHHKPHQQTFSLLALSVSPLTAYLHTLWLLRVVCWGIYFTCTETNKSWLHDSDKRTRDTEHFPPVQRVLSRLSRQTPSPSRHQDTHSSDLLHLSLMCSRTSYKQSHIFFTLLCLTSFTQHNVLKIFFKAKENQI